MLKLLALDVGLLACRTVRKEISVIQGSQSVIFCYGSPCRLMQTPKLKLSHNNCSQNTETPRNKPKKTCTASQYLHACQKLQNAERNQRRSK